MILKKLLMFKILILQIFLFSVAFIDSYVQILVSANNLRRALDLTLL